MKKLPNSIVFLLVLLPVIVVCVIGVVCVLIIPSTSELSERKFLFEVSSNGDIVWKDADSGETQLVVESGTRSHSMNACDELKNDIVFMDEKSNDEVECYEVFSTKTNSNDCGLENSTIIQDCILMHTDKNVFWYGGAQLYLQRWPINSAVKAVIDAYLSTDLPWRYGNVLERYWLSSSGVAIYVYPNVPLSVRQTANKSFCLSAEYNNTIFFGSDFSPDNNSSESTNVATELRYAVCLGKDAKNTHRNMLIPNTNGSLTGFIEKPTDLPDLKMMKEPIWSTWARYKHRINQTIVEGFAEEILENNFTNCQLEIDDGYETTYGDFTFDISKFPDARNMIENLHDKGFRVTTWVTPFINRGSRNFLFGRTRGYFIKKLDDSPDLITWWNGIGAVVDFTNPDAAQWYENLLSQVLSDYSIDSFKFDAGETNYVPRAGITQRKLSNPGDYTTLYSESAYKVGKKMMEMRSSWKTQSYPFYMRMMDKGSRWGGFKGLRTVIPTALIFGIIGYPYVLPDMIGGNAYGNLKPDKELFIRWMELTAFLPVMQFSITPWDYDNEVTELARYYVDIHRTVVYDELIRASEQYVGSNNYYLPISPIWYHAAIDEWEAYSSSDQFIVGSRYLVAPIVWEGARKRDIYLPRGPGKQPIIWRDMLRTQNDVVGGGWIRDYEVNLDEISWWERIETNN